MKAYPCEVEIMLEGEADITIDVDLLLAVNVLGAHLSPRHGALPGEL